MIISPVVTVLRILVAALGVMAGLMPGVMAGVMAGVLVGIMPGVMPRVLAWRQQLVEALHFRIQAEQAKRPSNGANIEHNNHCNTHTHIRTNLYY